MNAKTKRNILAILLAINIAFTLIMVTSKQWGAALGFAFLAFLIWNNKFRKNTKS